MSDSADIPASSRVVDLKGGPLPIGRASVKAGDRCAKLSNLYIRNSHLSKLHARLWIEDMDVYLEDVGSTFGTIWNNNLLVPYMPVKVYEGDTIGFVINRPSYVISALFDKAQAAPQAAPMVPLDKLLNPRVQLQFVVHSIAGHTVVLLPVNDAAADVSSDLVGEDHDVENTPDVVNADSDDEAPVEERIIKEVSYTDNDKTVDITEPEYVELLENSSDEQDSVLVSEQDSVLVSEQDSVLVSDHDEDADEDVNEEDEHIEEVDICFGEVCGEPFSDEVSTYNEQETDAALEDDLDEVDLEEAGIIIVNPCTVEDCCVSEIKHLFDENYDSADDDTFEVHCHESDEFNSELDTPSSDGDVFNSFQYSDEETVSESDISSCDDTSCHDTLYCDQQLSGSRKRTYDEADLEEPEVSKPKQRKSVMRTVLKELGKGMLYATGTILALAAYGSYQEK